MCVYACVHVCVFHSLGPAPPSPISLLRPDPHSQPSLRPLLKALMGNLEPGAPALASRWYLNVGGREAKWQG